MNLKSVTNTEPNTHELILEIDANKFEDAIEAVYKREKSKITIPGFRKGKATRKMIETHYGEGVFYEQAINSIINAEVGQAIMDTKLELVAQPSIEIVSIDKKDGVTLKATCITKPEVTIKEYKGLKAPKLVKDVTDEQINAQLQALRNKGARIISVDDRPAQLHDEVIIDFEGFKDGVPFEGGKGEQFPLRLGSGQFIPGFEDQIIGRSTGEEFEINVTFPEDYGMKDLAGQPTVFKVKIHEINVQELPELDDEFVKDTTEFETVEELKADIRKKLEESAERAAAVEFENTLFDQIIENVEGEIPECMYENRINALASEFGYSLQQQGLNLDMYLQYTGMSEEEFRESFAERAQKEVILRLGLEKIAELENITVTDEEIEEGLTKLGEKNGMDLETVKRYISYDAYKTDLIVSKAADLVKETAVIDNTLAEKEEKAKEE